MEVYVIYKTGVYIQEIVCVCPTAAMAKRRSEALKHKEDTEGDGYHEYQYDAYPLLEDLLPED